MSLNDLQIKIYSSGTTEIFDVDRSLQNARIESFNTNYPGGLFGTCRISVPRDITHPWMVAEGQRIAIYNGLMIVWEGKITDIGYSIQGDEQGNILECVGFWGSLLGMRGINKVWADIRISAEIWIRQPISDNDQFANIDIMNRINIGPQRIAWGVAEVVASLRYTMPTGETIKRIKATFKNRENGQDWTTRMRDVIGSATLFSESGDAVTTPFDHTLATPRQYVEFQFVSNAAQTPTVAYGRMSAVTIYSETGGITSSSVIKNIRAKFSDINADETQIAANAFALEPFMTTGREVVNVVLLRVASFGDASFNPWACYFEASDTAITPDGKPVLCFQQQPALTNYDYAIRMDEPNLEGQIELKRSIIGEVFNWIVVKYRDELSNKDIIITPDDDASLKDTTSIGLYGQLETVIDAGTATATTAKNYAKRVLAAKKNASWKVTAPIMVKGWLRTKDNLKTPVVQVRAGKRLKIENFFEDLSDVAGAGLTFLITSTEYRAEDETISLTCGLPDNLAVYLAQRQLLDNRKLL